MNPKLLSLLSKSAEYPSISYALWTTDIKWTHDTKIKSVLHPYSSYLKLFDEISYWAHVYSWPNTFRRISLYFHDILARPLLSSLRDLLFLCKFQPIPVMWCIRTEDKGRLYTGKELARVLNGSAWLQNLKYWGKTWNVSIRRRNRLELYPDWVEVRLLEDWERKKDTEKTRTRRMERGRDDDEKKEENKLMKKV